MTDTVKIVTFLAVALLACDPCAAERFEDAGRSWVRACSWESALQAADPGELNEALELGLLEQADDIDGHTCYSSTLTDGEVCIVVADDLYLVGRPAFQVVGSMLPCGDLHPFPSAQSEDGLCWAVVGSMLVLAYD